MGGDVNEDQDSGLTRGERAFLDRVRDASSGNRVGNFDSNREPTRGEAALIGRAQRRAAGPPRGNQDNEASTVNRSQRQGGSAPQGPRPSAAREVRIERRTPPANPSGAAGRRRRRLDQRNPRRGRVRIPRRSTGTSTNAQGSPGINVPR